MATHTDNSGPTTSDQIHDAAADAQARVQEFAGRAQEQADAIADQAHNRIYEQVEQRSTQAGEQITQQASDLKAVGDALREQGKDGPAQTAERLASYAERAGSYLTDSTAQSILSDAEDFSRERPAVVAAGALALGFAASRFLKASSGRRYTQRDSRPSTPVTSAVSADSTGSSILPAELSRPDEPLISPSPEGEE